MVLEGERWVAFVPFFARYPYEVYLAPKAHQAAWSSGARADVEDLAVVLKGLLRKFDALFSKPFPYSWSATSRRPTAPPHPESHLHFEFYPPLRTARS